mmetsp:Transcript_12350/g.18982  ORF Transcript_12350/g.18982 Transcript_12350/m.18982 type:complete len:82 (+) Transcript_12350:2085-2330(+)
MKQRSNINTLRIQIMNPKENQNKQAFCLSDEGEATIFTFTSIFFESHSSEVHQQLSSPLHAAWPELQFNVVCISLFSMRKT